MKKFLFMIATIMLLSVSAFAVVECPKPDNGVADSDYISSLPAVYTEGTHDFQCYNATQDVYVSAYKTGDLADGEISFKVVIASESSVIVNVLKDYRSANTASVTTYNSANGLYYSEYVNGFTPYSVCYGGYNGTTLASCLGAIRSYIDNPPTPEPEPERHNASFTLPAGNVAFVDFGASGQNYNVTAAVRMPVLSSITTGQFSHVSQRWYWTNTLPDSIDTVSGHGLVIPWYKSGNLNVFGQSRTGYVNSDTMVANGFWQNTTSGRYLVILNPLIWDADGAGNDEYNFDMTVNVQNAVSVKVYPTYESWSTGGLSSSVDSDDYYDGTFVDGETEFVNPDGAPAVPQYGGQNLVSASQTAESLASQIKTVLEGLVEKITTMFTATHTAIANLVSVSAEFFSKFGLLYAWLPSDVYITLQSGMIVAITIGVLKAFL